MKNIFKLGSVFLAIALLVSTALMSGVLVAAEPDWQLIYEGSFSGEVTFPGSCLAPIPSDAWNTAITTELTTYGVSSKYKIESDASYTGGGYACWGIYNANEVQWWGKSFENCAYPYEIDIAAVNDTLMGNQVDATYTFGLAGEGTCTVTATTFKVYAYREPGTTTTTAAETTATAAETTTNTETTATAAETTTATETSATETATATVTETTATAAETSATETATATQAQPTETQPAPIVTEAEPTATATATGQPVEYYGDVNGDGDVNMEDVLVLRKYLADMDVQFSFAAADVNGDNVVNMKDILIIRKFISGMISFIDT